MHAAPPPRRLRSGRPLLPWLLVLLLLAGALAVGAQQQEQANNDGRSSTTTNESPAPAPAPRSSPAASSGGGNDEKPAAAGGRAAGSIKNSTSGNSTSNATSAMASPVIPIEASPGWRLGRATHYGAPAYFGRAYDATRGEGSFGILADGSCGFTNADRSLPFPRAAYAALADADPDYPGSCGRCYALRCKTGVVLDNDQQPLNIRAPYNTYLPDINSKVEDTKGRTWPGNPLEAAGQQLTRCWNSSSSGGNGTSDTLVVRIADSCPCRQVLPDGSPGVAPGGEVRMQRWCCGGVQHFDISFDAYEQLAHPVNGLMMVEYRPVKCPADLTGRPVSPDSLTPLPFSPGFVNNSVVYGPQGTESGWDWRPYAAEGFWRILDAGVERGEGATCLKLAPGGGLSFRCKLCQTPGYQPLRGATALELVVRPDSNSTSPFFSATPQDEVPPLKVYLQNVEGNKYCNEEVFLNATRPSSRAPGPRGSTFYTFSLPLARFRCDYEGATLPEITSISFENASRERQGFVCIARVAILRDGGNRGDEDSVGAPAAGGAAGRANTTVDGGGGGNANTSASGGERTGGGRGQERQEQRGGGGGGSNSSAA